MIIAILFLRMGPVTGCLPSVLAPPIPPWGIPSAAGVAGEHPGLGWVGATHSNLMKIVITDLKLLALPFLDLSITSLMLNPEERVFSCPDES